MQQLPDIRVWRTANEYQEAASLCDENGKYWAGAILAALAVEIYLKSFLSQEVTVEGSLQKTVQIFKKAEHGHDLKNLFDKIPQLTKEIIMQESKLLVPKIDLQDAITRNRDVFSKARYSYEKESVNYLSNEIITLSECMRNLVIKVADRTHQHCF